LRPKNGLKSGVLGFQALKCSTWSPVFDTYYDGFYVVLLQKSNDSFENPSYRLIFGVIVGLLILGMNRTPKNRTQCTFIKIHRCYYNII
jgi:hypothetical protein